MDFVDYSSRECWDAVHNRGKASTWCTVPPKFTSARSKGSREKGRILARYFVGTRLVAVPSARSSRAVVLNHLIRHFPLGVEYSERDVNVRLRLAFTDYDALRRCLVDVGFLTRAGTMYIRTGSIHQMSGGVGE
ncbi:MAG: DUF2087 domain-containing protein [Actinobacteria bacterium]|nr:DUF2087 domain-containing protein [Actinomycetota bacterium]